MKLTKEQQYDLINDYQLNGNLVARDKIIDYNMGMVTVHAEKFCRGDYELRQDLIQEGVMAMLKYLPKYDITRGYHSSTYLASCARGAMMDYLNINQNRVDIMNYNPKGRLAEYDFETLMIKHKSVEQEVIEEEGLLFIENYLNSLKPIARDSFLASMAGYGWLDKVAAYHGKSRSTVDDHSLKVKTALTEIFAC